MAELTAEQIAAIRARHELPQMAWRCERDIKALLSHADALQAKVARLEGERDAKQRIVDSWEDGREWWECTKCGDRFHGISEEAPFHDGDRRSDPYCNTCGEGGQ